MFFFFGGIDIQIFMKLHYFTIQSITFVFCVLLILMIGKKKKL